jgi:glycosyltransferase involved in cell wall biosynthesis
MRQPARIPSTLFDRDLVVFANDWDGDPLSKTHIMRILARDNRILWVNSIGNRRPRANTHDLQRIWKKLTSFTGGMKEVEPNITVLSPLAIPLYGAPSIRAANGQLLRSQVKRAMQKLGFRRPISWSFLPASAPVSGTLGEELVVYHCVDEFSAFADTNGREIAEMEGQLLRRADLVITSAERLRANKARVNPNTVLVRHGVDFAHFTKACDPRTAVPLDIAGLPKPVLGFFGLLAEWVDLKALEACARAYPAGSVVILGKVAPDVDATALRALPNLHFLGRKPYSALPGYCRAFDVALMPFKQSELTLNANPLKVREYLAAGLPCVSTDLPEVRKIGLCRLATSASDFPVQVSKCLEEGAGPSADRAQRIAHESWEARVDEIRGYLNDPLSRRRGIQGDSQP